MATRRSGDQLTILTGTGQNIVGLIVFVLATFGTNVLISRAFGASGPAVLGTVTLATQFAFIGGAATRFGMDVAAVRRVSIDVGKGQPGRARGVVARAAAVAAVASAVGVLLIFAASGPIARIIFPAGSVSLFQAAAMAIPFVALCQVYLGGTRGLRFMTPTLIIFWAGQPMAWILLMVAGWAVSKSALTTVATYSLSWALATAAAWLVWHRKIRGFVPLAPEPGEVSALVRYGAPRAPAALLSQLLFWADYFVVSRYVSGSELGVYAAAVRVAQTLALFLIAVNYVFSPFVADLHARGERDRLDSLYKALTRWVVAGTIPLLLLFLITPESVLRVFGSNFDAGTTALRILLIGQVVNVAVGSVGFILIMVGRTGWDLAVYLASFALDVGVALALSPRLGTEGAAMAQAATMVVSNAARLYLVWRFVRIQPFTRRYLSLAIPAALAGAAMLVVHLAIAGAGWAIDLSATGLTGAVAYTTVLAFFGLTPDEQRAVARFLGKGSAR